jgi:hypothetical protein
VAILDGRIDENQSIRRIPYPKSYSYMARDWYTRLKNRNINVELIPASKISDKYSIVINPFGATYIEEDIANLCTLKKIKKFINNGGIFINIGDLAFWRSWNSLKKIEGFTSPRVVTYALDTGVSNVFLSTYFSGSPKIILEPIIVGGASLIDTWIFRQFGIRTTLGSPIQRVALSDIEYLKSVEGTPINEFRAALSCEKEDTAMLPLIYSTIDEDKKEGEDKLHECYPAVAVHQQIGYLVLIGIASNMNANEFNFVNKVIKLLLKQLLQKGKFKNQ